MRRAKAPKLDAAKTNTRKAQEVWTKLSQGDWETLLSPAESYQRKGATRQRLFGFEVPVPIVQP